MNKIIKFWNFLPSSLRSCTIRILLQKIKIVKSNTSFCAVFLGSFYVILVTSKVTKNKIHSKYIYDGLEHNILDLTCSKKVKGNKTKICRLRDHITTTY